ncbi:MAG: N-acetylmuramoyl-L-alanine amidase [Gammaproteobacteria bacterium]
MRGFIFLVTLSLCYGALARGIDSVRLRTEDSRARVVFDLQDEVTYRAFRMKNPERVVIDIDNVKYPRALSLPTSEADEAGGFQVLERLRYAVRNETGLRIVLDLKDKVALQHTALPPRQGYGHRLVVDLYRPSDASEPRATTTPSRANDKPKSAPGVSNDSERRLVARESIKTAQDDADKVLAILNAQPIATPDEQDLSAADSDLQSSSRGGTAAPAISPPVSDRPQVSNTTRVTHSAAVGKPPREVVVAIDAGHGGHDVGAIGPKGTYEKNIVLQISRELAAAINKQHGLRAVLTRSKDQYVALRERMRRARQQQADLFISIHADAFKDRRVRGSSVYVLSQHGASSEAARWLAENENAADLVGGVSLYDKDDVVKSVLLDLSQTASIDASIDAADTVLAALKKIGKVHKPTVQHAGFMVLKSPDIPSLLVETAFISNPTEEARLRSRSYQRKLARALTNGIVDYFNDNPLPDTRFAENYRRQHRVSSGDTLSEIAERYAVSMESIKLANEMSRDRVRTGEILTIP